MEYSGEIQFTRDNSFYLNQAVGPGTVKTFQGEVEVSNGAQRYTVAVRPDQNGLTISNLKQPKKPSETVGLFPSRGIRHHIGAPQFAETIFRGHPNREYFAILTGQHEDYCSNLFPALLSTTNKFRRDFLWGTNVCPASIYALGSTEEEKSKKQKFPGLIMFAAELRSYPKLPQVGSLGLLAVTVADDDWVLRIKQGPFIPLTLQDPLEGLSPTLVRFAQVSKSAEIITNSYKEHPRVSKPIPLDIIDIFSRYIDPYAYAENPELAFTAFRKALRKLLPKGAPFLLDITLTPESVQDKARVFQSQIFNIQRNYLKH